MEPMESKADKLYLELGGHREVLGRERPVVIVGRNPACDVVLDSDYVSRFHARFEYRGGEFYLRDESQNGTYVWFENEERPICVRREELGLAGRQGRVTFGASFEKTPPVEQLSFFYSSDGLQPINISTSGEASTKPSRDENNEVLHGSSDETEVFGGQKAVGASRRLPLETAFAYRLLEEYTDRIVVLLSREGFIIYYNQYLESLTRRSYREFVGQDFFTFVHPEDRQGLLDALVGLDCGTQEVIYVTLRLCTANPRWQSFRLRLTKITPSLQSSGLDGIVGIGMSEGATAYSSEELLANRYQMLNCLSVSNFCHTYLGIDTQRPSRPRCIIKRLSLTHSEPKFMEVARRLFYQEALSLEKLGIHDRIPLLLAYLEDKDYFYIIQEFIEGESLEKLMTAPWSVLDTLNLIRQILGILHYVHKHNVIHRDIKPANIIRRSFDGNYVLIDFGSVKLLPAAVWAESKVGSPNQALTVAIGTPGYVAPEQLLGKPTKASDIYSVGVIGIEALLGCRYDAVKDDWPAQLLAREVDSELVRILARMTETDVQKRYSDVSEVFLELNYLSIMEIPSLISGI
jgi:PAS domain-containing protein